VATRSLKLLGFSVLQATDGRKAVAVFKEYRKDITLVLLDMMMPGMGGADTFRELRHVSSQVKASTTSRRPPMLSWARAWPASSKSRFATMNSPE
jgi:DNA-binding response OmpR family regulator